MAERARAPRSILVIATRRLGDVLLTTPLLRSLRRAWPDARLDVVVQPAAGALLAGNPDIDGVLSYPSGQGFAAQAAFTLRLARRYDLAVSTLPGDRPVALAWLAGRRRIATLDPRQRWRRWFLTAWTELDLRDTHTVLTLLRLADAAGAARCCEVVVGRTAADEAAADAALAALAGAPYVALHPIPMYVYKAWTEAGWVELGRRLAARGLCVVFTGGPGADERAQVAAIARQVPGALDLSGRLSLGAVARVIAGARVYVGPDTVVTHLAAATGVPTVALFGPSNPVQWGPWPHGYASPDNPWRMVGTQTVGNVTLLQGIQDCVPCLEEGCDRHVRSLSDCLQMLAAERVVAAAEKWLARER